jgi:type VI secretion system protein ImpM
MSRAPQMVRIGYFGKLPAHGDFVKASDNPALLGLLDQWLAESMSLLSADPRWKLHYDELRPLDFAFVGTRSKRAIAGRIAASQDQSGRRFPFLAVSAFEVDAAEAFVARSPLVLGELWRRIGRLSGAALAAPEPAAALRELAAGVVEVEPGAARHDADFHAFLEANTLQSLQALLEPAGFRGALRQLILGLGLLLGPVRSNPGARLEKSLLLPLPCAPAERPLVAAFWLDLIAPFLSGIDVELALFLAEFDAGPALALGFCGAAPHTLQALIDPAAGAEHQIGFDQIDWVEAQLAGDPAARRLSACLEQSRLSLRAARQLFQETFL